MKTNFSLVILSLLLSLFSEKGFCQNDQTFVIPSLPLEITSNKTTNLIFPFAIKSVDRGSADILAQKAEGTDRILQIKAAKDDFDQTNLTVITADGKLHSFLVDFNQDPLNLNVEIIKEGVVPGSSFGSESNSEAQIKKTCMDVDMGPRTARGIHDHKSRAYFEVAAIAIQENVLYFRFNLLNDSNIGYDIENLRFFIRDQKRAKRNAVQEIEIKPLHIRGDTNAVAGMSDHSFVFALPKFTIPDKKYLAIQLMEKNGGRHLKLRIRNKDIMKARLITE